MKKSTFVVGSLLVGLMFFMMPVAPKAHAVSCTGIDGIASGGSPNFGTSTTLTLTTNCAKDYIEGFVVCLDKTAVECVPTFVDTASLTWHSQMGVGADNYRFGGTTYYASDYVFFAFSAGKLTNDVITIGVTDLLNASPALVMAFGLNGTTAATDTACYPSVGACNDGSSASSPVTLNWPSTNTAYDILLGFAADNRSAILSPSTGFTSVDSWNNGGSNPQKWAGLVEAKAVTTTQTNLNALVNFTGSPTLAVWHTWAVPFAFDVTVVVPCTFSQLQCWWYPLFFMGLYSGFILMVGTWLRTSPRGKSHLFLSAVTFGSLVAVIFGIMNIAFPLMMLVLNTIIALRLRG